MHIWIEPSPVTQATVALGLASLTPIAYGQAEAHRAQAAGVDPAARLVELVVLRGPHLVLADVGRDEGVAVLGQFHSFSITYCGLISFARAVVAQAVLRAPLLDLRPTTASSASASGLAATPRSCSISLVQHVLDVADDRHVDLHALGDRRRIDVDVDDLAVGCGRSASGCRSRGRRSARRSASSTSQFCIAMFASYVPCMPEHAEELAVGRRDSAPRPISVLVHGIAEQVARARVSSARRVAQDDAAAGVDHRAAWPRAAAAPPSDLPGVALASPGCTSASRRVFG